MFGKHCPDCNDDTLFNSSKGDGKCNKCGGTGIENVWTAPIIVIFGEDTCNECGESGECRRM